MSHNKSVLHKKTKNVMIMMKSVRKVSEGNLNACSSATYRYNVDDASGCADTVAHSHEGQNKENGGDTHKMNWNRVQPSKHNRSLVTNRFQPR